MLVHDAPGFRVPRVLSFQAHDLPIDLPKIDSFRKRSGEDELTIPELVKSGRSAALPKLDRAARRAEFHFRMVEVATMLLLPLLAVALAVPPKRSSSAVGVFLSIVMIVTYHKVNQYAADFAALGRFEPILALWIPFLIFAGLIWWMYRTLAHVPGGQPIGAVERAADTIGAAFRRWFRLRRRRPTPAEAGAL